MKHPVIAIGLDAAPPALVEKLMEEGCLSTLSQLRSRGSYARLRGFEQIASELWTSFLAGCPREATGYWDFVKFFPRTYEHRNVKAYNFEEHKPFYALGDDFKVAVIDVPQSRLHDSVNGIEITAWGAHAPRCRSMSKPASLFQEIVDKHGANPLLGKNYLAKAWDVSDLHQLREAHRECISRRTKIYKDLMSRESWDLFLTVYGETHVSGHFMWHLGDESHPLYESVGSHAQCDGLKDAYLQIDQSIAEVLEDVPDDTYVLVFSGHGMSANTADVPSMVVLPEFLYRLSFPGERGLDWGDGSGKPGPPMTKMKGNSYEREVWSKKSDANPFRKLMRCQLPDKTFRKIEPLFGKSQHPDLISPFRLKEEKRQLATYIPANWYSPLWHKMKAFALQSFSDGLIRINLKGREAHGVVEPSDYDSFCEELSQKLHRLRDARTGKPIVKEVVRTRQSPFDDNPKLPDADLFVAWQKEVVVDTVDSPDYGRFGPIPHRRTGAHIPEGFLIAKGPGIEAGSNLAEGHILDLPPTILKLMGAPIPSSYEGSPLL